MFLRFVLILLLFVGGHVTHGECYSWGCRVRLSFGNNKFLTMSPSPTLTQVQLHLISTCLSNLVVHVLYKSAATNLHISDNGRPGCLAGRCHQAFQNRQWNFRQRSSHKSSTIFLTASVLTSSYSSYL